MVTITHISDSHMSHNELDLEGYPADILIHSGDYSGLGSFQELVEFNRWLGKQPFPDKINVAGNHDKICANMNYETTKMLFTNSYYLEDNLIEIKGLKIYGTPWSKRYGYWSFMKEESELDRVWAKIPEGIDILVVHGPPYGILDKVPRGNDFYDLAGSKTLRDHILYRVRPRLVCCGHIHCDAGQMEVEGIKFSNAAVLDDSYCLTQKPQQIVL